MRKTGVFLFLIGLGIVLVEPSPAYAYIGPGAGFALAGSFLAVFAAFFSAPLLAITWPIRLVTRGPFRLEDAAAQPGQARGYPGTGWTGSRSDDQNACRGQLPNLAALRDQGCFKSLGSTLPPISPVAWSSFQTGVNPGKHNIFDFLIPDLRTYQPKLSSVEIRPPRRSLRLGKYQVPLGKADVRILARANRSGASSAITAFSTPLSACRSRFLRKSCAAYSCRPCASRTCAAPRAPSRTTPPSPRAKRKKRAARLLIVTRIGNKVQADLIGPQHPLRSDLGSSKSAVYGHNRGGRPGRAQDRQRQIYAAERRIHGLDSGWFSRCAGHEGTWRLQIPFAHYRSRI